MKLSSKQIIAISSFVILSLVVIIIFSKLKSDQQTVVNFFTLYGTFASVFGICITYLQIKSVKEANEGTELAIWQSLKRTNQLLSVAEISKSIKVINEIQNYISYKKYDLALIRLRDLKFSLIQNKYNNELESIIETEGYKKLITNLGVDISNIDNLISTGREGIDFNKVKRNLATIETILSEFENKLKYINHES